MAETPNPFEAAVARAQWGRPTAAKRGRNPEYPWVPVIDYGAQVTGVHTTRTRQVRAVAFRTRDEAVDCAARTIADQQQTLLDQLQVARCRALREYHGLPRELADVAVAQ